MVHKTVHEAFTNHNKVLANTIGNVMKDVFFGAPVDQVGPAYSNGLNPSAMGSNIPESVAEWWAVPAATSAAASRRTGSRSDPINSRGARSSLTNGRGQV